MMADICDALPHLNFVIVENGADGGLGDYKWAANDTGDWRCDSALQLFCKINLGLDLKGPLHGKAGLRIRKIARSGLPPFFCSIVSALAATGVSKINDQDVCSGNGFFSPVIAGRRASAGEASTGAISLHPRDHENRADEQKSRMADELTNGGDL